MGKKVGKGKGKGKRKSKGEKGAQQKGPYIYDREGEEKSQLLNQIENKSLESLS